MTEEQILKIFTQILIGLNTLHLNNIDHRDLKPANILLYHNGEYAKIADLGLARSIDNSKAYLSKGVGTMDYWAPELWKKRPA